LKTPPYPPQLRDELSLKTPPHASKPISRNETLHGQNSQSQGLGAPKKNGVSLFLLLNGFQSFLKKRYLLDRAMRKNQ
jgi:hypothetical protein